jgi:hypothetical protein
LPFICWGVGRVLFCFIRIGYSILEIGISYGSPRSGIMKPKKLESLDESLNELILNYKPKKVKPASLEDIRNAMGSLTKEEADALREEVRRSREEDWR